MKAGERGLPWHLAASASLGALSAVLFWSAFPNQFFPEGLGWTAFIALAPLALALSQPTSSSLQARLGPVAAGIAFGALSHALLYPWVAAYHPWAPALLIVLKALGYGVIAAGMALLLRRFPAWGWLGAACLWTGTEYAQANGFLAFPYAVLGYSQYAWAPLLRSAALWGVHGVSFILACVSMSTGTIMAAPRETILRPSRCMPALAGTGCIGLILIGLGVAYSPAKTHILDKDGRLSILLLQADTEPRSQGARPAREYVDLLKGMVEADADGLRDADLVVTPETVYPYPLELGLASDPDSAEGSAARALMDMITSTGKPWLLGNASMGFAEGRGGRLEPLVRNSVLYIEGGRIWASYDKRRLVPFSEDFPFRAAFPRLRSGLASRFGFLWTPGESMSLFSVKGSRIGTPICYEDCFGADCADFARAGADLLLSVASDAWSRSRAAMSQHLACAAFRAVETGLPLLRATNDGLSCLISPEGRVLSLLEPFLRASALYSIPAPSRGFRPYMVLGDMAALASAAAAVLLLSVALAPPLRRSLTRNGMWWRIRRHRGRSHTTT